MCHAGPTDDCTKEAKETPHGLFLGLAPRDSEGCPLCAHCLGRPGPDEHSGKNKAAAGAAGPQLGLAIEALSLASKSLSFLLGPVAYFKTEPLP